MMECSITESWNGLLETFPEERKDIYYTEEYVSLYQDDGHRALCAVCRENDRVMLFPFLRGMVREHYDFETAYGYGGPISNTADLDWCHEAFGRICDWLRASGYICGFIRFHPLLSNERLAQGGGVTHGADLSSEVIFDRRTVAMDTSRTEEQIWEEQISSKNRNMVRKAEKNHLVYGLERDLASLDGFAELYHRTMLRLGADDFYFFDSAYFSELKNRLKGHIALGTVRKDGRLICAALFLYSACYGHYHLEGSDRDYASLGANNLLLWRTACEFHKMGIRRFHLGGGATTAEQDPLYRFKRAFNRDHEKFYIGKVIFDIPRYKDIAEAWERENPSKVEKYGHFLLRYRY